MVWPTGSSEWKTWPTSKSAMSPLPLSAFLCAALQKPRQQARAHVGKLGGDRVGEREFRRAAAEMLGFLLADEGPGDRLHHAARGERPARERHALLREREHGLQHRRLEAREGRRGHPVEPADARDLLDEIGLAFDVRPPGGRDDFREAIFRAEAEAEPAQGRERGDIVDLEAGEALGFAQREIDRAPVVGDRAGEHDLRSLAAANLEHHAGRELEPRKRECRIDAALETIARIRVDAELAAGLGDIERIPKRRFDEHIGRLLVAARGLSAHDAADRFDAVLIGDHHHALVECSRSCRRARGASRLSRRGAR